MTTFAIDADNGITAFSNPDEATGQIFSTPEELAALVGDFSGARLVDLWNSIPGVTPVKKFMDRKAACRRIWAAAQSLETGNLATEAVDLETAGKTAPAGAGKATSTPKAPKASKKAPKAPKAPKPATTTKHIEIAKKHPAKAKADKPARDGSKKGEVLAMLRAKGGATLDEIMKATGWQKHTVRGFMAGAMKKAGYTVDSFKTDAGDRTYAIRS